MLELIADPPIPTIAPALPAGGKSDEPFAQTVRLVDESALIASARWHAGSPRQGVGQILDLVVAAPLRRQGHGKRMLQAIVQQAQRHFIARKSRLRRMWIAVEQKEQIIARAFLTGQGFHHVSTIPNLLQDQDALIYSRTFD